MKNKAFLILFLSLIFIIPSTLSADLILNITYDPDIDGAVNQAMAVGDLDNVVNWKVNPISIDGFNFYGVTYGDATSGIINNQSNLGQSELNPDNTGCVGSCDGNRFAVGVIDLQQDYDFTDSILNVYCRISANNHNALIYLLDSDGNCEWCYDFQDQNPKSCDQIGGSNCPGTSGRGGTVIECTTAGVTLNFTPTSSLSLTDIRYLVFGTAGAGVFSDARFNNFEFNDIVSSNNSLPMFNISINNTQTCLNQSTGDAQFFYDIQADDPDGDTIYYADRRDFDQTLGYLLTFDTAYYDTDMDVEERIGRDNAWYLRCILGRSLTKAVGLLEYYCNSAARYDVFPQVGFLTEPTRYTEGLGCNTSEDFTDSDEQANNAIQWSYVDQSHRFYQLYLRDYLECGDTVNETMVLFGNPYAADEPEVTVYFTGSASANLTYNPFYITSSGSTPTAVTEEFLIVSGRELNDGNLTFYYDSVELFSHESRNNVYEITLEQNGSITLGVYVDLEQINETIYFGIVGDYEDQPANWLTFVSGGENTSLFIDNVGFYNDISVPSYTTDKPNNFTFTSLGNYQQYIWVTDQYHLDTASNYQVIGVSVTEYCLGDSLYNPSAPRNQVERGRLATFLYIMGSLIGIARDVDSSAFEILQSVGSFVYLIVFLLIFLSSWDFFKSMFLSSFIMFVYGLIGLTTYSVLIVAAIILGGSIMVYMRKQYTITAGD